MAKKTTKEEVKVPEGAVIMPWHEAVTFDPSNKTELNWLYELLKSLGITQLSVLEGMIARAQ